MINRYLSLSCLIFSVLVQAQDTVTSEKKLTREKPALTEIPNESSSFIGDSNNMDPLKANRDNIKEDEEPVLEEIKQVLDAPADKPTEKPIDKPIDRAAVKGGKENKSPLKKPKKSGRNPDNPDLSLERKFHNIYKTYNINPTPVEVWSAATAQQTIREYTVQKNDTLWSISNILFGDSNFWPKIWALNKQGILNPHFITPSSKIYFYMGDKDSAPSLAVGTTALPVGLTKGSNIKSDNASADPGVIPDSLPLSRNGRYFADQKKTELKIDLGEQPRFDFENTSEIYITNQPIKTDVKIEISETSRFRCYDGRILGDIRYIGKLVEDYEIYESLNSFKTTIGTMYAYRVYGRAKPYQIRKLKMYDCKGILASDLIIIPKEKMQTLRNRKISVSKRAAIIGGPDVVEQRLFVLNQIAYVDFGAYEFSSGQEYKTKSQVTDEINGHFKVIQKYGSFAVVLLTDVNDVIEIGDKVILN